MSAPTFAAWILARVDEEIAHHAGRYERVDIGRGWHAIIPGRWPAGRGAAHAVTALCIEELAGPGRLRITRRVRREEDDRIGREDEERGTYTFPPFDVTVWPHPDHASADVVAELIAEDLADHRAREEPKP